MCVAEKATQVQEAVSATLHSTARGVQCEAVSGDLSPIPGTITAELWQEFSAWACGDPHLTLKNGAQEVVCGLSCTRATAGQLACELLSREILSTSGMTGLSSTSRQEHARGKPDTCTVRDKHAWTHTNQPQR